MSPRNTWLSTRSTELRAILLDLGLTITDAEAQSILDDKVNEYATMMRVSRQTAQRSFGDEHLARFLDMAGTSVKDGANLPEGLAESGRAQFAEILSVDADGIRAIANDDSDDAPELWRTPNPR